MLACAELGNRDWDLRFVVGAEETDLPSLLMPTFFPCKSATLLISLFAPTLTAHVSGLNVYDPTM